MGFSLLDCSRQQETSPSAAVTGRCSDGGEQAFQGFVCPVSGAAGGAGLAQSPHVAFLRRLHWGGLVMYVTTCGRPRVPCFEDLLQGRTCTQRQRPLCFQPRVQAVASSPVPVPGARCSGKGLGRGSAPGCPCDAAQGSLQVTFSSPPRSQKSMLSFARVQQNNSDGWRRNWITFLKALC